MEILNVPKRKYSAHKCLWLEKWQQMLDSRIGYGKIFPIARKGADILGPGGYT